MNCAVIAVFRAVYSATLTGFVVASAIKGG